MLGKCHCGEGNSIEDRQWLDGKQYYQNSKTVHYIYPSMSDVTEL